MAPAVSVCTAAELRAPPSVLQGATGSMLGRVWLRNVSRRRCAIGGRPHVRLIAGGRVLPTKERTLSAADGARSVSTVAARGRVAVYVQWLNWCGAWPNGRSVRAVRLALTLTTGVRMSARVRTGRARCDAPAQRSRLDVSSFRTVP